MNERCKEALYHSWGKAPERKKLESDYNRNYYSKNKQKWGVKGIYKTKNNLPENFIGPAPKSPSAEDYALTAVGQLATMVPGGGYLYDSPQQYASYIKEDINIAKKFVKTISKINAEAAAKAKKTIAAAKKFVSSLNIFKKIKEFKEAGQAYMQEYY